MGWKWLHKLGFEVLNKKKGVYIDGHEQGDVVEHRKKFLRQLVAGGFLTKDGAPNDEAKNAFPDDIESPSAERREKKYSPFMMKRLSMQMTMKVCSGEHLTVN